MGQTLKSEIMLSIYQNCQPITIWRFKSEELVGDTFCLLLLF